MIAKKLFTTLVNSIYPPHCMVCNSSISNYNCLCKLCASELVSYPIGSCPVCLGESKSHNRRCNQCNMFPPYFDYSYATYVYQGPIAKLLIDLKYNDRDYLVKFLAMQLQDSLNQFSKKYPEVQFDMIIPVPSTYFKIIKRGYPQTVLLAYQLSKLTNISYYANYLLCSSWHHESQVGLSLQQRKENLNNNFTIKSRYCHLIKGKSIILLDDIVTTGSTIKQASKVIKQAGAKTILALSVARVEGSLKIYYN